MQCSRWVCTEPVGLLAEQAGHEVQRQPLQELQQVHLIRQPHQDELNPAIQAAIAASRGTQCWEKAARPELCHDYACMH